MRPQNERVGTGETGLQPDMEAGLTPEELEAHCAEALPERSVMSTLNVPTLDAAAGTADAVTDTAVAADDASAAAEPTDPEVMQTTAVEPTDAPVDDPAPMEASDATTTSAPTDAPVPEHPGAGHGGDHPGNHPWA